MLSDLDYVSQELSVRSVARFNLFPVNGFIDSRKHTDVFLVQQRSWQQEAFTQLSGVNVAMTTIHPSILRPILRMRKFFFSEVLQVTHLCNFLDDSRREAENTSTTTSLVVRCAACHVAQRKCIHCNSNHIFL